MTLVHADVIIGVSYCQKVQIVPPLIFQRSTVGAYPCYEDDQPLGKVGKYLSDLWQRMMLWTHFLEGNKEASCVVVFRMYYFMWRFSIGWRSCVDVMEVRTFVIVDLSKIKGWRLPTL